ncbi:MAG: hypothetical protein JSR28_09140 [Proteobacteria bacterium]|nr:hypothetical protein [Pseudomonadota bacterium]
MKLLCAFLSASAMLWAGAPAWDIHARLAADGRRLAVEARFAPGDADAFMVDPAAAPFLSGVEVESAGQWRAVPGGGGRWPVADAEARGAHLRWTFDLGAASRARRSGVRPFGTGFLFRPRVWLLRPETFLPGRAARLVVDTPPGLSFVSGLGPGPSYATRVDDLDGGPEAAFGAFSLTRFAAKGGVIAAIAPDENLPISSSQQSRWFKTAASALEDAYGRLPLPWTAVFLLPVGQGSGVLFGSTRGEGGAAIVVLLGQRVSDEDVTEDWVLTHELIHTALPDLERDHHWLEEGIPTYLEPLLRLREGRETAEAFWDDLRSKLPQGQPQAEDRGLDRTPTWGRTYWGGALFCFVADLRIREASGGKQTLLDALRAMLAAGGIASHDDIRRLLAQGDSALTKPVLVPLYDAWAEHPETVDLDAIWKRLGVTPKDDRAPEGALRQDWGKNGK